MDNRDRLRKILTRLAQLEEVGQEAALLRQKIENGLKQRLVVPGSITLSDAGVASTRQALSRLEKLYGNLHIDALAATDDSFELEGDFRQK